MEADMISKNRWRLNNHHSRRKILRNLVIILTISMISMLNCSKGPEVSDDVAEIAIDAYTFGLPLVLSDITRRQQTNTTTVGSKAPMNYFNYTPFFPDATFRDIVRPNNDTYYSIAWLDLSNEPIVLTLPNTNGRYHLMQIMDAYTNVFAAPGTRTTGNEGGSYLISGPDWTGSVPAGMTAYKSGTNYVWIIGRTQVNSKEDGLTNVAPLMQNYKLAPLSGASIPISGIDPTVPIGEPNSIVADMSIDVFFNYLNQLMVINPPSEADHPLMQQLAKIGVEPGGQFNLEKFSAKQQNELKEVPQKVLADLISQAESMSAINGWSCMKNTGNYGTDYTYRALVACFGLGANLPEDALYYTGKFDADGIVLNGANQYVIQFEEGKTPPVNAFWSLTLYDQDGYFVDNELNRYAIGDRSNLEKNPDGTLSIYIQHANPGEDKESNWLPTPSGAFNMMLRAYYPKEEMLKGSWIIPAVKINN
jgi:DNA sulfur modification protein DndE